MATSTYFLWLTKPTLLLTNLKKKKKKLALASSVSFRPLCQYSFVWIGQCWYIFSKQCFEQWRLNKSCRSRIMSKHTLVARKCTPHQSLNPNPVSPIRFCYSCYCNTTSVNIIQILLLCEISVKYNTTEQVKHLTLHCTISSSVFRCVSLPRPPNSQKVKQLYSEAFDMFFT